MIYFEGLGHIVLGFGVLHGAVGVELSDRTCLHDFVELLVGHESRD